MANERITEDLVDEKLRNLGYYEDAEKIIVEKQQSAIELVRKSLSKASKTGGGGGGFPEFIITAPDTPDMIVVIECKAETRWHEWVKRQNVCFSRRVDLSDKMCAFLGVGMGGLGVLFWGYVRPAQPCRMAQEGLKSVSMPVS